MNFYDEMRNVVKEVLPQFKQGTIKYVVVTSGNGTADNPGNSSLTEHLAEATVKGVSYKFVKDGFALSTDLTVTMTMIDGITPNMKDFIIINGVKHKIISDISSPAGEKVVWKFIVRKGG